MSIKALGAGVVVFWTFFMCFLQFVVISFWFPEMFALIPFLSELGFLNVALCACWSVDVPRLGGGRERVQFGALVSDSGCTGAGAAAPLPARSARNAPEGTPPCDLHPAEARSAGSAVWVLISHDLVGTLFHVFLTLHSRFVKRRYNMYTHLF